MSNVLVLSPKGLGYAFATRIAEEGHDVTFYTPSIKHAQLGAGIDNPKVTRTWRTLPTPDYVICTGPGLGGVAEEIKRSGYSLYGGGRVHDLLEQNQGFAESVITKYTDLALGPGEHTDGIDLFISGIFDGTAWLAPFTHGFCYRRFMEGNKGPDVNGMGTLIWHAGGGGEPAEEISNRVMLPLAEFLRKAGYIGTLTVFITIYKDRIVFNGFSTSCADDATLALTELLKGSWAEFLQKVLQQNIKRMPISSKFGIAIRLSVYPYPGGSDYTELENLQVLGVPEPAAPHVWFQDVKLVDDTLVLAGCDGIVATATAWGETPLEARRRVYRTIHNISLTRDLQYRNDVGNDYERRFEKLKRFLGKEEQPGDLAQTNSMSNVSLPGVDDSNREAVLDSPPLTSRE